MDSALFLQIVTVASDLIIFLFVAFYIFTLQRDKKILENKEKDLEIKKSKIDAEYRQTVENALSKERKILDDAAQQANSILSNAQYVTSTSKEVLEKALQQMIINIQKEAQVTSENYAGSYKNSLTQVSEKSLGDYQNVVKKFETDLQTKMQEFRDTLLPNLQKELDEYKKERFKNADKSINTIIQRVAQKVLNKSISLEDHKNLIIDSLEKSRKEGIFD